jgi:hypothetical protein
LGDKSTNVKVGNINQNVINGSSIETIVNGSKKISIKSGSFIVEITAGDVQVKTNLGAININSIAQTVDINGALTVTIKSGVKLNLSGPQVQIGSLPAIGGVITGLPSPTHLDFVTGLPLIGSKTVMASI